jgi:hypothetical protein
MVHEQDGELVVALNRAELAEKGGHLGGGVFIGLVETDQRIEDQQLRPLLVEGLSQPRAIARGIEAQRRGEDETDLELTKIEATHGGDSVEALLDVCGSILGGVE